MMELQAPDNAKYQVRQAYLGKSTDDKPVNAEVGATLFLTDTFETYIFSARDGWQLAANDRAAKDASEIKHLLRSILDEFKGIKIQLSVMTDNCMV